MARPKKIDDSSTAVMEEPTFDKPVDKTEEKKEIYVPKSKKEQLEEKLKPYIQEEGLKKVKGRFRNYEVPGGRAWIQVKKYPENMVPPFKQEMEDNKMYEIPLYVARFLNGVDVTAPVRKIHTCSYAVHGFQWDKGKDAPESTTDERGMIVPKLNIDKRVRRYGFESMEFDSEG